MKRSKSIVCIVTAIMIALTCVLFIACSPNEAVAQTNSPEVTPVATPTIAPTPTAVVTPEPTPKPTHAPELPLEEERALLGVKNKNDVIDFSTILVMYFSMKDIIGKENRKIAWIFTGLDLENKSGIYDNWSEKKLYSIHENKEQDLRDYIKVSTPVNKRLEDSTIIEVYSIMAIDLLYEKIGLDYALPEEMLSLYAKGLKYMYDLVLPMKDVMDLDISCTPKEYRTTWMDFDESLISNSESPQP